jgi:PAS domain-containing protein
VISGQVKIELNQESHVFRELANFSRNLVAVLRVDGQIEFINKRGRDLLQLESGDEYRNVWIAKFIHPDYHRTLRSAFKTLKLADTWRAALTQQKFRNPDLRPSF